MKKNPLYAFLKHQTQWPLIDKENFLIINLPQHLYLEHHITVHPEYEEGVGFKSLYHYTAILPPNNVVHIYVDKYGNKSQIHSNQPLSDDESMTIDKLFLEYVDVTMNQIHLSHTQQVNELTQSLHLQLHTLHEKLFETYRIEDMLEWIETAKASGLLLEKLSYANRQHTRSLKWLDLSQEGLIQELKPDNDILLSTDSLPLEKESHHPERSEESPNIHQISRDAQLDVSLLTPPKKSLSKQFEVQYQEVTTLLQSYDQIIFNDFETKINTLENIRDQLSTLVMTSDEIVSQKSIQDKQLNYQLTIGLESLFQAYQAKGTLLLDICLSSKKPEIIQVAEHLVSFAKFISHDRIDRALKQNNTSSLLYLLQHSTISIDQYKVQLPEAKGRSLLCATYQMKLKESFEALVKSGANIFTSYENDLPLIHHLFCLPMADEYRQAFFKELPGWPQRASSTFKKLAFIIKTKISERPDLVESARVQLMLSLQFYESFTQTHGTVLTSRQIEDETSKLQQFLNQDALEALRQLPEYAQRCQREHELNLKISTLLKKQKKAQLAKNASLNFFKQVNHQVDESQFLQNHFKNMTQTQLLEAMDRKLMHLEDLVFLLTQTGKNMSKNDLKAYNKILNRASSYEQDATNNPSAKVMDTLTTCARTLTKYTKLDDKEQILNLLDGPFTTNTSTSLLKIGVNLIENALKTLSEIENDEETEQKLRG